MAGDVSRTLNSLEDVTQRLEHTTQDLDKSLHQLLQGEEEVETELKNELKADKELEELTNKALHAVDEIEKVEEKLEQHERAAEQGMDRDKFVEAVGHDLDTIDSDITDLRTIIKGTKRQLKDLEQESSSESQQLSSFEDVINHLDDGLDTLTQMDEKIHELNQSGY